VGQLCFPYLKAGGLTQGPGWGKNVLRGEHETKQGKCTLDLPTRPKKGGALSHFSPFRSKIWSRKKKGTGGSMNHNTKIIEGGFVGGHRRTASKLVEKGRSKSAKVRGRTDKGTKCFIQAEDIRCPVTT